MRNARPPCVCNPTVSKWSRQLHNLGAAAMFVIKCKAFEVSSNGSDLLVRFGVRQIYWSRFDGLVVERAKAQAVVC